MCDTMDMTIVNEHKNIRKGEKKMNKTFKKTLGALLSASMIAASVVLPTAASADDHIDVTPIFPEDANKVIAEWKFDFGAADQTPDAGFTAVAPTKSYYSGNEGYGFLGLDEEEVKLGNRLDAFGLQKGQKITLTAGGGAVDGIGSTGEDAFENAGDEYYPTRFALKADDETYYRVKATVTTLDPTQAADASVYTERKHPIITHKTIAAGETETVTFSVRPTPIYYEKSEPKGTIADGMVNVCVLGKNTAIASLEIQKVEPYPVFWVLGDSTVTDGNCELPFWPLQNYTGVGTGLTKYLPRNLAMVNEGEGGLNAADNYHYNMVASRIKAGDYLYVEYGHNHKNDGPTGYVANLDKYYNKCHEVGAKLIIVSPIERINTFSSGAYQHTLDGFATAGQNYVADKVTGGATDIAYVNLNQNSLDFYNKVVTDNDGNANAIKYYFQTAKGGGTDQTHPNDAGAEALAYEFIKAAKAVTDTTQKAVLDGFMDNITTETANLLDISSIGSLAGDAWPTYVVQTDNEYPVVINEVVFDDEGKIDSVSVKTQAAKIKMESYGIVVITVKNEDGTEKGKIYAVDQVDNSVGYGPQTITNFRGDVTLEDGDTYTAIVMKALDSESGLAVDTEANLAYSAEYVPSDIVAELLLNEDGDGPEDFDYFGKSYGGDQPDSLSGCNGWTAAGSAGRTLTLGEASNGTKYTEVANDGAKNGAANQGSFYIWKALEKELGTTGKYLISMDIKYVSGDGLNATLSTGNTSGAPWGTASLNLFTVNGSGNLVHGTTELGQISATDFSNVQFILDMDLGKGYASVNGGTPVEIDYDNYQTTSTTVTPAKLTNFMFDSNKKANDVQVASLRVAELKRDALPKYTATVAANDAAKGTVSISGTDDTGVAIGYDNGTATVKADEAMTVYLIEAKYTGNALTEVIPTKMEFTAAGTKTQSVTAGSKLMVWKTLDGVEPVVDAITATGTIALPADNEVTDAINTVTTVTATPAQGSVFMGWYDNSELTGDPVSMDNPYTFRLRGDITLTAKFVKEPTLTDVTDFKLSGNATSMKKTVGSTVQINAYDAADASGTPYSNLQNSDIAWSCDETGINVSENGVVTIGDTFSMGSADTKVITIKGTLNGVTKTYEITVFGYEYYEEIAEGITDFNGTFVTIASKQAIAFPGGGGTSTYKLSSPVALDIATTIDLDNAWSGANTAGQNRTLKFYNSSNTELFNMYYSWGSLYVGGTELTSAITKDTWTTVSIAIDPSASTVTVTVGGNSATTALAANAGDIARIDMSSANGCPGPDARSLAISKVKITK